MEKIKKINNNQSDFCKAKSYYLSSDVFCLWSDLFSTKGGEKYKIITDHLGSVRYVVRVSDGAIVQQIEYDSFGNIIEDTNPTFTPFAFAGGIYDKDTGLIRFGARDYDPEIGRFILKDQKTFWGGDSNLYNYAINDPINLIDPIGSDWIDAMANVSAGVGDVLLLGFGDEIREWLDEIFGWAGSEVVDKCSGAYKAASAITSLAMTIAGTGRLAYAAGAKAIGFFSKTAESAIRARNSLKIIFRLGIDKTSRIYSIENVINKYGSAKEAIKAAGRTNKTLNTLGGFAGFSGINTLIDKPECGCN